jgi:hypothetical protein
MINYKNSQEKSPKAWKRIMTLVLKRTSIINAFFKSFLFRKNQETRSQLKRKSLQIKSIISNILLAKSIKTLYSAVV